MGFSLGTGVPALTVFLQGLLSFFSPCVLPLIPLYMGYLAGGGKVVGEDGSISYPRKKILINTIFFIVGVSFAFFLLGFGFSTLGRFFSGNRSVFARIGGVIVILFGLFQLGVFGSSQTLGRERRLPLRLDRWAMNPLVALVLGFVFSFAWTPCVGPALASVLLMAASAESSAAGFALVGVYTLGFVLPFLAVGLFTGAVLGFFKRHQKVVRYTVKAGGVLLILMGIMMITGWMNGLTGYLSSFGGGETTTQTAEQGTQKEDAGGGEGTSQPSTEDAGENSDLPAAPQFTLVDQNGVTHTLSQYRGKTVFLNFWATWCGPCRQEMPDIQALYEKYGSNEGELVVLGVANPKTAERPQNSDKTVEEVKTFLEENHYTYPTLMDTTGELFAQYGISSFPTTFMIDKNGRVFGYLPGMMTADIMESIVRQTMSGKREG